MNRSVAGGFPRDRRGVRSRASPVNAKDRGATARGDAGAPAVRRAFWAAAKRQLRIKLTLG